uniref:SFRICE_032489 n=1 Tax=Spodoptera frugiperda TaxID=7108 RepID=A0A2H1WFC2_SPOFR
MSGFTVSGIWPFNCNIFTELDFAPSYVTDRPELIMPEVNDNNTTQELAPSEPVQKTPSPTPGTSTQTSPPVTILEEELGSLIPANERNPNDFIMKPHTSKQQKMRKLKPKIPKKKKKKVQGKKKKQPISSSEEDESEDVLCLICFEPWSASKPNEEWVQCTKCKLWVHTKCGGQKVLFYCCPNCASEDESDSSNTV